MIYSPKLNFIFFHIPKNGGGSIWRTLFVNVPGMYNVATGGAKVYKHIKPKHFFQKCPELINTFKAAFVRNPFERLVSLYHWGTQGMSHSGEVLPFKSFDEYIYNLYDSFKSGPRPDTEMSDSLELQIQYLFDDDKKLIVDFVGRFENLNADFHSMCRAIGIEQSLDLMKKNTSKHRHYSHYYNEVTQRMAAEIFEPDLEVLKYGFEDRRQG